MTSPPSSGSRFVPIRLKMAVVATLLAVVPLAAAGWGVYLANERALLRSSLALQLGVAEDVARTLVDQIEPVADSLQAIAEALADPRLAPATRIAVAQALVTGSRALARVSILDDSGAPVDAIVEAGGDTTAMPPPHATTRARANAEGVALFVAKNGSRVVVYGVARIRGAGAPAGFVMGEVPLAPLQARISRLVDTTFVDAIEDVFVVDKRGPILAQHSVRSIAVDRAQDLKFLEGVFDAAKGNDVVHTGAFTDHDGVRRIGGLVSRSNAEWAVVVQTSETRALAPVTKARNIVLIALSIAALLAMGIGIVSARRFSRPLERLATMATALAARDFSARVEVNSHDELGVLSDTMNATAVALKDSEDKLIEETEVRRDIARYLPAELVDAVVRREHDLRLGGERRQIAVLFADIVAFTPLSEQLAPEKTVALLNELFTYLTEIIFRHHGTVDKFIGDSVMALFGVVDDGRSPEEHARHAVECAEEMLQWLEVGNATWSKTYGTTVRLAIGVNLGPAVVGNIGTDRRMEFTAIGQTVNVAARLESVARPQQILVTQDVVDACGDALNFRPLGEQPLTGTSALTPVYALET